MLSAATESIIQQKYEQLQPYFNEASIRAWAASEALSLGHGGITSVSRATGLSRTTIHAGMVELAQLQPSTTSTSSRTRIRQPGGGRKALVETDTSLLSDLEALVDPATRGDPESPLRWTSKSSAKLTQALQDRGHQISPRTVCTLLDDLGYSLQANRKTREGKEHPERDEQFQHIADTVMDFQKRHQPVISVDAKKKELIGNYKNGGQEWQPQKMPVEVNTHDFIDKRMGKVIPYGVYDITENQGWVTVGIDHDTAQFAVASIRQWWYRMGQVLYPAAQELMITADWGGSNSYRTKLWKWELQQLANEFNLTLHLCHFPPGTSKWNKIEHRLFSQITENWRSRALVSREVVVNLIASTKTSTGLSVNAALDEGKYPTGIQVSKEQFNSILIEPDTFHGEWNYQILPMQQSQ
jgi:transposase